MNGVPFVDVTVKGDEPAIVTGAGTRIFAVATTPPPNTTPGGGFLVGVTIPPAYVPISQTQLDLLEQSHALPDEAANDREFAGYSAMRRGAA
jgi:hypothetical protein